LLEKKKIKDFEEDEYTIGRGEDCSFRIQGENSKRISNLHCKIYRVR